jgi:sirohydrochlorin cobaltochelatase
MEPVIVLAMHGSPPNDFPKDELTEFFSLHTRLDHVPEEGRAGLEQRYAELDAKIRAWPRTPKNDPFYAGTQEMASHLNQTTGYEVIVGFNEFCAPSLDEAIEQAVVSQAEKIIVITPMMTRGGEHSEVEIPKAIQHSKERHPDIDIVYAWPFEVSEVAEFLSSQIKRFV